MIKVDKIKLFKVNKKLLYCILIVTIVGVIAGSLFVTILKDVDKASVTNSLESFITEINNNEINYGMSLKSSLITNISLVLLIWLLGISIIGLPIIIFIYFIKAFSLGFTISSILINFKLKELIYSFIYIFPHNIINLFVYAIVSIYSIIYSFKLINSFFNKAQIDFKPIIEKNKYVLLISILVVLLTSLYGTYIMPYVFKIVLNLLK